MKNRSSSERTGIPVSVAMGPATASAAETAFFQHPTAAEPGTDAGEGDAFRREH